jgi:hypothetical protein
LLGLIGETLRFFSGSGSGAGAGVVFFLVDVLFFLAGSAGGGSLAGWGAGWGAG